MFMGEYNHTVDEKGRLIIPLKFREELGNEFVITKGLDGCLFGFEKHEWAIFEEKLNTIPLTNKEGRRFSRYMLGGAAIVETDKQGRVLIPANLRTAANLEKDIVVVGVANRIEIWDKVTWEQASVIDDMDDIAGAMADLGI